MAEAFLLIQLLTAAAQAGMTMMPLLEKISAKILAAHTAGTTLTADDLKDLFDEGDELEAAALAQFEETLADQNTPKIT